MDLAPMEEAIRAGDAARVRALLAEKPDYIMARNEQGVSLISLACYYGHKGIAGIFLECGGIPDIFDACAVGDENRVTTLVRKFPHSLNSHSPDGFYPLGLAAFFGNVDVVRFLLAAGADVNQHSNNALKVAPIHSGVANGNVEIVRMLLEASADPNSRQQSGFTPLHGAAAAGRLDLIELLLNRGANPALQTDDGKRPDALAGERGHPEAATRLRNALV